jgi:hypothetical protein
MSAVIRTVAATLIALALAGPVGAVGLGPLRLDGIIDGPREGFALTLFNPYTEMVDFVIYPRGVDDEAAQPRVAVFPSEAALGGGRSRSVLVIADDLAPGETYQFRVCAQRKTLPQGIEINARVCSKITAHRIG